MAVNTFASFPPRVFLLHMLCILLENITHLLLFLKKVTHNCRAECVISFPKRAMEHRYLKPLQTVGLLWGSKMHCQEQPGPGSPEAIPGGPTITSSVSNQRCS